MSKKFTKKPQDFSESSPDVSPEKKRTRPNWFDMISSDDDEELNVLPPTTISQNDPLFQSGLLPVQEQVQEHAGVSDEEWNQMMRMTRKQIPGINISSPSSARRRREKRQNQLESRRLFNDGKYKTTSRSPKKLDHEIFDQLLTSSRQGTYLIL